MKFKQDFFVRTTVIIVAMVFLIAGAKVVRYTIMKSVLVDMSIGHGIIRMINNSTYFSEDDNDLANEWWADFCALPEEKLKVAKGIIGKNQFKMGDYECDDPAVLKVLSYYSVSK